MELAVRDGGRWLGRSWLGRLALAACLAAPWAAATVAPLAVAPAVAVAQDEGESEGDGKSTAEEKSYLVFLAEALGIKYIIIFLLLSFSLVAMLVMCFLQFRKQVLIPPALVQQFEANLDNKEYQQAFDQAMKLEHKISYVSLIGALAPMFGLLGTVDGMVAAFMKIAGSDTAPKPSELAVGISQALVTTLIGLWLAIPAIACFALFKNWLQRFNDDVAGESSRLMSRFQSIGKK